VIDLRLWRTALLPIPIVVLVGMFSLQEVPPHEIYRFAGSVLAAAPDADGLYVPCPQWQAQEAVEAIERDFGKPVIAGDPAATRVVGVVLVELRPGLGLRRTMSWVGHPRRHFSPFRRGEEPPRPDGTEARGRVIDRPPTVGDSQ